MDNCRHIGHGANVQIGRFVDSVGILDSDFKWGREMDRLHRSEMGTYHADPDSDVAWGVNDTRGTIDGGPECSECGQCECPSHGDDPICRCDCDVHVDAFHSGEAECIGLSFAYCCLDGGESYCQDCFDKLDDVEVVDCDCP